MRWQQAQPGSARGRSGVRPGTRQMSGAGDVERRGRLALSLLASPADPVLGAALRTMPAAEILAAATGSDSCGGAVLADKVLDQALLRALRRWREKLGQVPAVARLAAWQATGLRLLIPGDEEWPAQLDDLGDLRPVVLWARGSADLRQSCAGSVSIVGSRAATGYGSHVAIELAAVLAEKNVGVVSGGA